jgi:hypothetical protein
MKRLFALVALLAACTAEEPITTFEAPAAADASDAAVRIEQAERVLERGGDAAQARALLEAALAETDITTDERSAAVLALSRALEALGDEERAVAVIEAELAAHAGDRGWSDRPFRQRLRKLFDVQDPGSPEGDEPVAAFASALLPYFEPDGTGKITVQMFRIGGDGTLSDRHGTFNVGGAVRAKQEKDCPLCEHDVDVSTHVADGDWTLVPAQEKSFDRALVVFYFDLGKNRIPARYEHHLPMKVADIERELEAGKAFVVARERRGAPPVILLAAPRTALLADVEQRIVGKDDLPLEPLYVPVKLNLRPEEIQSVVRKHWFDDVRSCYETLQQSNPRASGKFHAVFEIDLAGKIGSLAVETDDAPLRDEAFLECLETGLASVTFPASSEVTKVRYPVVVTPD